MAEAVRPFTAGEAAAFLKLPLRGPESLRIVSATSIDKVAVHTVSFTKSYGRLGAVEGGPMPDALIIGPETGPFPEHWTLIRSPNPRLSFARVLQRYFVRRVDAEIHPSAVIDRTASIEDGVSIGPGCVVGPFARIGRNSVLRSNVVIGRAVRIGENCLIKSNSVIGEEGFGIVSDEEDNNFRIPHVGSVTIDDYVEIGALNTVCSGTIEDTRIASFVKTDDHVHIAHNCSIGANTIIAACAEISGSVSVGRRVWIGPNACVMNGVQIGDEAFLGLGTVVTKPVPNRVVVAGSPARVLRSL